MPVTKEPHYAERDEDARDRPAKLTDRNDGAHRQRHADRAGDGQRMAGTERHQRAKHSSAPALLQPERDRKQPAHSGIDAVKGAERNQHRH